MPDDENLFDDPIAGPLYSSMCASFAAVFGGALARKTNSRLWAAIIAIYAAFMAILAVGSFFELRRVEREQAAAERGEEVHDA